VVFSTWRLAVVAGTMSGAAGPWGGRRRCGGSGASIVATTPQSHTAIDCVARRTRSFRCSRSAFRGRFFAENEVQVSLLHTGTETLPHRLRHELSSGALVVWRQPGMRCVVDSDSPPCGDLLSNREPSGRRRAVGRCRRMRSDVSTGVTGRCGTGVSTCMAQVSLVGMNKVKILAGLPDSVIFGAHRGRL